MPFARLATCVASTTRLAAAAGLFATLTLAGWGQEPPATPTPATAQNTSSATTYTAPLLMFDAGVLVGWPNGAKVHIALLSMLQFIGSPVMASPLGATGLGDAPNGKTAAPASYSTPALTVASGTQVFIGPVIGFDLGL